MAEQDIEKRPRVSAKANELVRRMKAAWLRSLGEARNAERNWISVCDMADAFWNTEGTAEAPAYYLAAALSDATGRKISANYCDRLRRAGTVRRIIAGRGDQPPDREKVLRPLTKFYADEQMLMEVWSHAKQFASDEGEPMSGRHTRAAVEKVLPAAERPKLAAKAPSGALADLFDYAMAALEALLDKLPADDGKAVNSMALDLAEMRQILWRQQRELFSDE